MNLYTLSFSHGRHSLIGGADSILALVNLMENSGIYYKVNLIGGEATTPDSFGFGDCPHWLRKTDTWPK
jgi:hypothetical protein